MNESSKLSLALVAERLESVLRDVRQVLADAAPPTSAPPEPTPKRYTMYFDQGSGYWQIVDTQSARWRITMQSYDAADRLCDALNSGEPVPF
jgi:hypothetical protein